ncbi:MAG: Hint domain-containing protein [Paracoccaceae bacterium]
MFDADDGVLAPVHALANGTTIRREAPAGDITYVHLVFDSHEIVEAEGLAAESLHPCARSVALLPETSRREILGLFPARLGAAIAAGDDDAEATPPARPSLRAAEAAWWLAPFLNAARGPVAPADRPRHGAPPSLPSLRRGPRGDGAVPRPAARTRPHLGYPPSRVAIR